jgi:hypothetical protein
MAMVPARGPEDLFQLIIIIIWFVVEEKELGDLVLQGKING